MNEFVTMSESRTVTAHEIFNTIEKTDNGMYMYCDNLWLKTKLRKNEIIEIFSKYRRIEPYSISELTEDEKESVDIYMGNEVQYCDFADVLNEFENENVISMYWD